MRNLTRKLFLSIFTLAICAVTLVSTTFAWYTTNTEVNATNINGGAASTGQSSISVSTSGDAGTFYQTVDLTEKMYTTTADGVKTMKFGDLTPVQLVKNGTKYSYVGLNGEKNVKVLTFSLWFKTAVTDKDVNVYISGVNLVNSTWTFADIADPTDEELKQLVYFDNLLYKTGTEGGLNKDSSTYFVDIVKTLGMSTVSYGTDNTRNDFDLETLATPLPNKGVSASVPNAVEYYNKVMGTDKTIEKGKTGLNIEGGDSLVTLEEPKTLSDRTIIATLPMDGTAVQVDFTVFINGWDEYCFDVIKGQTFSLELQFSSEQN